MSKKKEEYYLLLSRNQPLPLDELEEILLEFSQEYRDGKYKKNEIINWYKDFGYYIFISSDDEDILIDIKNELRDEEVIASVVDEDWMEDVCNELEDILDDEGKIYISFNGVRRGIQVDIEDDEENYEEDDLNDEESSKFKKTHKLVLTPETIDKFDEFFKGKIIGQDHVLEKIKEQLIMISYETNENKTRPAGIFFFAGPTGVGKTEMCKALSQFLYNNEKLNRFDMSEYKSEVAIQKLIGAPNGYVGYDEGGTLINSMKKNPNAIVLFDEIEKCDKTVYDLFLQILDEGFVTSNKGEKISFKNNFIIFTSNLGAKLITPKMNSNEVSRVIKDEINYYFTEKLNRPEILGRIGRENIINFNLINKKQDLYKILDIHFDKFSKEMESKKIKLSFNKNEVYDQILIDVDLTKGARDIRNEFEQFKKHFVKALYERKISYKDLEGKSIKFSYDNVKVKLE